MNKILLPYQQPYGIDCISPRGSMRWWLHTYPRKDEQFCTIGYWHQRCLTTIHWYPKRNLLYSYDQLEDDRRPFNKRNLNWKDYLKGG